VHLPPVPELASVASRLAIAFSPPKRIAHPRAEPTAETEQNALMAVLETRQELAALTMAAASRQQTRIALPKEEIIKGTPRHVQHQVADLAISASRALRLPVPSRSSSAEESQVQPYATALKLTEPSL